MIHGERLQRFSEQDEREGSPAMFLMIQVFRRAHGSMKEIRGSSVEHYFNGRESPKDPGAAGFAIQWRP